MVEPVIHVDELSVRRDESGRGLDPVSFRVGCGEIVLLRGDSGAGKSTLLRVLAGTFPHFHGGRICGSARVAGLDVLDAPQGGGAVMAALLFQDPEAQAVMSSVREDVEFGPRCLGRPAPAIAGIRDAALAAAGAQHLASRRIATLSAGERQRVALASVLAMGTPVLLLDEPGSQLDRSAVAMLADALRRRADRDGTAILIADHTDRFLHVADRRIVLGAEAGPPSMRHRPPPGDEVALWADRLSVERGGRRVLDAVDIRVRRGEHVALVGDNGAGKTTLLRGIAGLDPVAGGRVVLGGVDVSGRPVERRVPAIGMVAQDPGRHLITESVADEVDSGPRALGLGVRDRRARGDAVLGRLGLRHLAERHPLDLSGGERQRVAIAAALTLEPQVLLLDEPTRGMDRVSRQQLHLVLDDLVARGGSVVIATHDDELIAAAHRVLRVAAGRVVEADRVDA